MLTTIQNFDLISGSDLCFDGGCVVRQPKLKEIRNIGYQTYQYYLMWLSLDVDGFCKLIGADISQLSIPVDFTIFDIFTLMPDVMQTTISALHFFIVGDIQFSEHEKKLLVVNRDGLLYEINNENYFQLCSCIMQICGVKKNADEQAKPKNAVAQKIADKLKRGKERLEAAKRKQNPEQEERNELWNIIGAVSAYSPTYNLINVWELTIPQLYDQFARINNNYYVDIAKRRWCTWGEGDYTLDPWFSVPKV